MKLGLYHFRATVDPLLAELASRDRQRRGGRKVTGDCVGAGTGGGGSSETGNDNSKSKDADGEFHRS